MKITFTLDQVKKMHGLPPEERERIINNCDHLSEMSDNDIESYRPDDEPDEIVAEVHTTLVKRVAAKRRRRERKAAKPKKDRTVNGVSVPLQLKVTMTEGTGRLAMSLRNSFNQFVNQVVHILGMFDNNNLSTAMIQKWKVLTQVIYTAIQPLAEYAKEYLRLPRQQRRPMSFTVPVNIE